jgi:hypothetical protein
MKKIFLIMILLLCIGCNDKKENDDIIKYRLGDNEKLAIELKEGSDLHYAISESFYIEYKDELFGSVSFINLDQCNDIINTENLEKIKEDEHGFSYKEINYHYLYKEKKLCVLINAKELDNLNKILDNIDIRIEKEN